MVQSITRIKVFGERNTGTNFIEDLVRNNLDVGICPGDLPRPLHLFYNSAYRFLPYPMAWRLVEGDRNRRFDAWFDRHAGWKHARLPNLPKGWERYPDGVGFIAVTKNPYAWLQSLHRRPYQGKIHSEANRLSFSEFLRAEWPTVEREYGPATYSNPVRMWNDKVASYDKLHAYGPTMILPYESVIEDIEGFVRTTARTFGLSEPAEVQIRTNSTKKHDTRTTDDIVKYYRSGSWAKSLTAEDLRFINDELDHSLREKFGYAKIETPVTRELEATA
jgi:hypothetical protein